VALTRTAGRFALVRKLALDGTTVEIVATLRAEGIRAILLKGAATAHWLYADPLQRPYWDIDLLVSPADFAPAEAVLARRGFDVALATTRAAEKSYNERHWFRGGILVDLHHALYWPTLDASDVWRILTDRSEVLELAGGKVEVLAEPARALLLCMHAAQHGREWDQPMFDLSLALDQVELATWREAMRLAVCLGAGDTVTVALRLVDGGEALAKALSVPTKLRTELWLRAEFEQTTSAGFMRLVKAGSWRERIVMLAHKLLPTPGYIRTWKPLACRGTWGLLLAYLWRPFWVAWHAPRGVSAVARAWLRSRRTDV
jgi:hypothetical protein